jgi:hypothetical protein
MGYGIIDHQNLATLKYGGVQDRHAGGGFFANMVKNRSMNTMTLGDFVVT